MRPKIKRKQRTFQISLSLKSTYLLDFCMFAASVFIARVNFFLCISFDLQKERTKERRKEPFFTQAHHRHNRHIAIISFQLKISTPFRKPSTKKNKLHSIAFLFCFNSKYHVNFFMCKNNGEMITRCRRYNALKLSCMTKYVFWSPIFPPQTTKLTPPNRSLSST